MLRIQFAGGVARWEASKAPLVLAALGTVQTRRASHVVPARAAWRLVFRVLRLVGDAGPLAWLSRRLPGPWLADMGPSGGPVLGPYTTRRRALAAEQRWLFRRYN